MPILYDDNRLKFEEDLPAYVRDRHTEYVNVCIMHILETSFDTRPHVYAVLVYDYAFLRTYEL